MRIIAFAVVALTLVACHNSSDSTGPVDDPGASFIGTWDLASVNGVAVPAHTTVSNDSVFVYGRTLVIERQSNGCLFVVQLKHRNGKTTTHPSGETPIEVGDGIVVVGREGLGGLAASAAG